MTKSVVSLISAIVAIILSVAIVVTSLVLTLQHKDTSDSSSINSFTSSSQTGHNDSSTYSDYNGTSSETLSSNETDSSSEILSSSSELSSSNISSSGSSSTGSSSQGQSSTESTTSTPDPKPPVVTNSSFTSAIWYSYEDLSFTKDYSKSTFESKIDKMFDDAVSLGADTVICHVRAFGDAWYYSEYFPMSKYITGTQGKDPGYDPLKYMVKAAHSRGLSIHAWLNPYRVSYGTTDHTTLSKDHPARKWLESNDESTRRNVLKTAKGIYFNPTKPEAQQLIINGIKEILKNYDVDGIHIDDYFYPENIDLDFDGVEYAEYNLSGGDLSQADWRRANVSSLVQGIYRAVHNYKGVVFGVSPSYHISNNGTDDNYNKQYADLAKWMRTSGYIDYIVPQIYFGYEHNTADYIKVLNNWLSIPKLNSVKLYIGLAPYKIGLTTDGGSDEWLTATDILANQTLDAEKKKTDGIFLFNYSTLFKNDTITNAQRENLKEAIKTANKNRE